MKRYQSAFIGSCIVLAMLVQLTGCKGGGSPKNKKPHAQTLSVLGTMNNRLPVTLNGSDEDGYITDYRVRAQPAHGVLQGIAPNLTYVPDSDFFGSDTFSYSVEDDKGSQSAPAPVYITIEGSSNANPQASSQSLITRTNLSLIVNLAGTDSDGTIVGYEVTTLPANGSLSGTAPNLVYNPALDFFGNDSFEFVVIDDQGARSAPASVAILVSPNNLAPAANAQSVSVDEDTGVVVTLSGSDPDGTIAVYSVTAVPGHGTLSGSVPNLTYTPSANYSGSDSFDFTVTDNEGATSAAATVSITVNPVNDPPLAVADSFNVAANTGKTFDAAGGVLMNDSDPDSPTANLTVVAGSITTSNGGTVNMNADGSFTYIPAAGRSSDSFSYTLQDNDASNPQTSIGSATINKGEVVWYVDAAAPAPGTGTNNAPFNTLAAAAAEALTNETIFVYAGNYDGGVTLASGVTLSGESEGLSVDGLTVAAGAWPSVSATGSNTIITLGNANVIKGITLSGGGYGLDATGVADVTVQRVNFFDNGNHAIHLVDVSGAVSVQESSINNASGAFDGINIDNTGLANGILGLTVNYTQFAGNGTSAGLANALQVATSSGSTLNMNLSDIWVTDAYGDGVAVDIYGSSGSDSVIVGAAGHNNTFTGVHGRAIRVAALQGAVLDATIVSNILNGNALSVSHGVDLFVDDAAAMTAVVNNNTMTDVGDADTDMLINVNVGSSASAASLLDLTVDGNSLETNAAAGVYVNVVGGSDARVRINNNFLGGNGSSQGVRVITSTSATETCAYISNNSFGTDVMYLEEAADGSILRVPDVANIGALSNNNNSVTVNTVGGIGFGQLCTIP